MPDKQKGQSLEEIVMSIAKRRKITLRAAAKAFLETLREKARHARQFGTMPEDYDPASDENHPNKGWAS